ncbi:MAG TPA: DUF1559 domain-containing protein [Pirellulaceae bacterium]|nr:DUF1559 domain-containing protein [Pirellulaceae bacterium]
MSRALGPYIALAACLALSGSVAPVSGQEPREPAGAKALRPAARPYNFKIEASLALQEADAKLKDLFREQRESLRSDRQRPLRTWTDADGNQIDAQLVENFAGMAALKRADGQLLTAIVAQLSKEDQKYLDELTAAAAELRQKESGGATAATVSASKLKIVGLGIHIYHDNNRQLIPAYSVDGQGKPLLSWRVHLLPYIGGKKLHALFRLDEPWDSEHNRQLVGFMPDVFAAAGAKPGEGKTNFLAVRGAESAFPDVVPGKGLRFGNVQDGLSHTVLVVEAGDQAAQEWTRPDDWEWSAAEPLKNLVGLRKGGFLALFADGRVELVSDQNEPPMLNAIFGRADGQPVNLKPAMP